MAAAVDGSTARGSGTDGGASTRARRARRRVLDVRVRLARWQAGLGGLRLAVFVVGVGTVFLGRQAQADALALAVLALLALGFIGLVALSGRVASRLERLDRWLARADDRVHRAERRFDRIRALDWPLPDGDHPYAHELDLLADNGLSRLLDVTVTTAGQHALARRLLESTEAPETIRERQDQVRELAVRPGLRRRYGLLAAPSAPALDTAGLLDDIRHIRPAGRTAKGIELALWASMGLLAATAALALAGPAGTTLWLAPWIAYALLQLFLQGRAAETLGRAVSLQARLQFLSRAMALLDTEVDARLAAMNRLWNGVGNGPQGGRAAALPGDLARLRGTVDALGLRANPLVHIAVNAVVPWDLWFVRGFSRATQGLVEHLGPRVERLGAVEASLALAEFSALHPEFVYPSVISAPKPSQANATAAADSGRDDAALVVRAEGLAHPLLDADVRIANPVSLRVGHAYIVTGSNMSGKSTYLRTVGVNLVLAQAGAPVCAERFEFCPVRLFASIRVADDLASGVSLFYAEVRRMQGLLRRVRSGSAEPGQGGSADPPLVYLIDELFRGTNNRERLLGARAVIEALIGTHACGYISTHDLALTELANQDRRIDNLHFRDQVVDSELRFDYQVRPGPCPTTNALHIMRLAGLPVPSPDAP